MNRFEIIYGSISRIGVGAGIECPCPSTIKQKLNQPHGTDETKGRVVRGVPVIDDGKVLILARGTPGAKLKRWKTLTPNKTMAKQQEAKIKTDLMMGRIKSVEDGRQRPFVSWLLNNFSSTTLNAKPRTLGKRLLLKIRFCLFWGLRCWVGLILRILRLIETTVGWHQVFKKPASKCRVSIGIWPYWTYVELCGAGRVVGEESFHPY